MATRLLPTTLACALLAIGASQGANAATVTATVIDDTGNAPTYEAATPASSTNFVVGQTGSAANDYLSPYAGNSNGTQNTPYDLISKDSSGAGNGIFNTASALGQTSYTFLWGSPDGYNEVELWSAPNGGGTLLGTISGNQLSCYISGACMDTGFAVVNIMSSVAFESIEFADTGQAAFEFGTAPLPAALPLFAAGLGVLGMFGARRKRKQPIAVAI